jgi:D-3-phosphoglycerate dehydrogenase
MGVYKALVSTVPFGVGNPRPLLELERSGVSFELNRTGRKLRETELAELISDFDVLIAGTEPITEAVMARGKRLKLISRVGIGLDNVDLLAAERRGIFVSYTPEAPAPAVAELTLGLLLSLLRSIHTANSEMHRSEWKRHFGRRLTEVTFGVIGLGRIGSRVAQTLYALGAGKILAHDINPNMGGLTGLGLEWTDKETIYREADAVTLHVPLNHETKNMIRREQLMLMKREAVLVNTSRGGIINEGDLLEVLRSDHLSGAAIDVFEEEPYRGGLSEIERCILTAHMGSMSVDCRARMEMEATEEAIRLTLGEPLINLVPAQEYQLRRKEVLA